MSKLGKKSLYCPTCGVENERRDYCRNCQANLAIILKMLDRKDAVLPRSRLISKTGFVAVVISEGVAWTLTALLLFAVIIFTGIFFLPVNTGTNELLIALALLVLVIFCGVPFLLGLVLILKDLTYNPKLAAKKPEQSPLNHNANS
ncbi:MAG: hypothetical protein JNN15_00900 [Blastocatellia bacterium]|nr:hypothetical protein [Blastocatellia bacterium]